MDASSTSRLEFLRSFTLSGLVQEEVIRRIKVGELNAGDKLNEAELASHLKISRSPVREAFSALEEARLVRLEKNRGAFVREISNLEAVELYQVRAALDDAAGRLLAPVISKEQLDELRAAMDGLEASTSQGVNAYFPLNIRFHDRVVEMAGNTTLLHIYRQTVDRMHLLRRRGFLRAGASDASHAEHRVIVDALASRDPQATANAMRSHVASGFARTFGVALDDAARLADEAPL
jgi:DNA-binding GntR family transcriptional regulator